MSYKFLNKYMLVFLSIFLLSIIFFFKIDEKGKTLVNDGFNQAVLVFGVAKGLNGAISLAQGTQIQPPGLSISVGEVLDPVNDLVEQFSWIMLASITSLGLQKIMLNFVDTLWFNSLLVASIVFFNFWLFFRFKNDEQIRNIFFKLVLVLVFFRFSIPFMTITNNLIYNEYVKTDYNIEKRTDELQISSDEINKIALSQIQEKKQQVGNNESILEKSKNFFSDVGNGVKNIFSLDYYKQKIENYKQIASQSSDFITDLIIAFVFKAMFFPLIFLFFLYQLLLSIFRLSK